MAKEDYWRLRLRELATKVDTTRGTRCPEEVDEDLKEVVDQLNEISNRNVVFVDA